MNVSVWSSFLERELYLGSVTSTHPMESRLPQNQKKDISLQIAQRGHDFDGPPLSTRDPLPQSPSNHRFRHIRQSQLSQRLLHNAPSLLLGRTPRQPQIGRKRERLSASEVRQEVVVRLLDKTHHLADHFPLRLDFLAQLLL